MKSYARVLSYFAGSVWAIEEEKFHALCELMSLKGAGIEFTESEIEERLGPRHRSGRRRRARGDRGPAAVRHDRPAGWAARALERRDVDRGLHAPVPPGTRRPPGRQHPGPGRFSRRVGRRRQRAVGRDLPRPVTKPIVAVADALCCSAAYDIASAAGEFYATPSARVGSIGVFMVHYDQSKAAEMEGVKPTIVSAGKYKTEGHPFGPLDDEALGAIQQTVNDYYQMFVSSVARNRGVSVDAVRTGYGEGRALTAKRAQAAGMIDGVMTFDEVLRKMSSRSFGSGSAQAEDDTSDVLADDSEPMLIEQEAAADEPAVVAEADGGATEAELERRRRRLRILSA
jgi:hypothetical protein